nr:MAG TPA: hypothetical protein [Caudoviricetes sp.]
MSSEGFDYSKGWCSNHHPTLGFRLQIYELIFI